MNAQNLSILASSCYDNGCARSSADVIVVSGLACLIFLLAIRGFYRYWHRRRPYEEQIDAIRSRFNGRATVRIPVNSTSVTIEEITRIGQECGYTFRDVVRNSSGPLWVKFRRNGDSATDHK